MPQALLKCMLIFGLIWAVTGCKGLSRHSDPGELSARTRLPSRIEREPAPPQLYRMPTVQPASFEQPDLQGDAAPNRLPLPRPEAPNRISAEQADVLETLDQAIVPEVFIEPTMDLDLTGALSIAAGQNPRIAFATARYREAYARYAGAQTLWLPSIRAGVSYNHHDGTLQASGGDILNASRSSFQGGLGTRAVGAGSPAVPGLVAEFHVSDAVFQPKITGLNASARDAAAEAAANDTLLATALAYLDLLRTTQRQRITEATRDNAEQLAKLTQTFADAGQGPQADADRTQTELVRRTNDVSRAEEASRIASARLTELLSLDPLTMIKPQEATIVPIDLVSPDQHAAELVAAGLANRPELAEAQYLVCEAVNRYRREQYAPLLPSVLLGVSQSGFGGGFGSNVNNIQSRFDFDASVYWELRNFGFGEQAKRDETSSQYDQARALQVAMMDRVAREVIEAHTQVQARQGQIEVAESGVEAATNSYNRNMVRIHEGQGLPIEVLQSMQALDAARQEYLSTLADYNESQFRLQRALGWPIH